MYGWIKLFQGKIERNNTAKMHFLEKIYKNFKPL